MTAPDPSGGGPMTAMKNSLKMAGLNPSQIDWVYAHGTGSQQNDRAEAKATSKLEIQSPMSSTKGIHGHSLAASGVLETALVCLSMNRNIILGSHGSCPEDFSSEIIAKSLSRPLNYVIKNALGFGGINTSLVIQGRSS